ncbi:hypothetical protein HZP35_18825, partial [Elizabethkingia anophelis]|nr:hypothetical protein [Elizabethkingia anophelis]MCT4171313.1 hypothetical protein [Elizabethkingia anophelis]MCT4245727.1 hypothetical protein [Elizabethkingia anophelis]MCT4249431.1 hypothetical protein [Elizabethkingia anophelis]MCT4260458.1 hypothetical protein [Elizabethkingia anophelis]
MDSLSNRLKSSFKEEKSMVQIFEELNKEIKMDKLELKDIAPYLPYKVKVQITEGYYAGKVKLLSGVQYDGLLNLGKGGRFGFTEREYHQVKLLLRPISDLTKEITHNGETFIPLHRILEAYCFDLAKMDEEYILSFKESLIEVDMSYKTAQMLHEMHFDTEKLIERG